MANNRMYLLHVPTGIACWLGKRMGWGWYRPPDAETLSSFYEYISENCIYDFLQDGDVVGSQDDFIVVMEDPSEAVTSPCCAEEIKQWYQNWRFDNSGTEEIGISGVFKMRLPDDK